MAKQKKTNGKTKKTNGKTKKNHKNKLVKRLHGLKNY